MALRCIITERYLIGTSGGLGLVVALGLCDLLLLFNGLYKGYTMNGVFSFCVYYDMLL